MQELKSKKHNWQTKNLGEVCDFSRGLTYSKKDEVDFSSNVVLRANNVNLATNSLDFSELKYINDNIEVPKNKKVKRGSVIICTASGSKNHLGKAALIDDDYNYAFGGFMGQLVPRSNVNSQFLFYRMISYAYKEFISKLSDGANINNLRFDDLAEFRIPLPPLLDQQRIVKILDKVFEGIAKARANAEKNLANARELSESYLQDVFETTNQHELTRPRKGSSFTKALDGAWEEKKLGEAFVIKPQKREAHEKLKSDDLVSFVPMKDLQIRSKEFPAKKERMLKEVAGSYTYFANEDVLLAKITPCFENGKIGIARNLKNGIGFGSSEYIVFRTKGAVIPDYLFYFLSREQFRQEGRNKMMGAVGHKRISKEFIEEYIIPFPESLSEQRAIVAKLDALFVQTKKLEAIYQQKLVDLEELKKSVLQRAFAGEL